MKALHLITTGRIETAASLVKPVDLPMPVPSDNEILVKVSACGVCHTELDEIEGRMTPPRLPVVPGHQVVGRVVKSGSTAKRFPIGERVGVAWIHSACGTCEYCLRGDENLCRQFVATGRDVDGGYAEYVSVREDFSFGIPAGFTDAEAAPLLCAGAIGYRSLRLTGLNDGQILGLTGFGGSGHLVLKMARHLYPASDIFVFARGEGERAFARSLGAAWAGPVDAEPPARLHSIIDTTPAWKPVVESLKNLVPGGRLVINGIRKEEADKAELMRLEYAAHLWLEKEIKSVANVSRRDVQEFLELAARIPLKPEIQEYPLFEAPRALLELKLGNIRGAKVLRVA